MVKQQCGQESLSIEVKDVRSGDILQAEALKKEHEVKHVSKSDPAKVRVNSGMTKSIGVYESLRLDVALELPCDNDEKSIEETFTYATDWVATKLADIAHQTYNTYSQL